MDGGHPKPQVAPRTSRPLPPVPAPGTLPSPGPGSPPPRSKRRSLPPSPPCCLSRLNRKWEEKIPNPSKSHLFQVGPGWEGGRDGRGSSEPVPVSPCPHALYVRGGFENGACRAGAGGGAGRLRELGQLLHVQPCRPLGPPVHEVPCPQEPVWSRRESGVGAPGAQGGLGKGFVLRALGRCGAEWFREARAAELAFEVVGARWERSLQTEGIWGRRQNHFTEGTEQVGSGAAGSPRGVRMTTEWREAFGQAGPAPPAEGLRPVWEDDGVAWGSHAPDEQAHCDRVPVLRRWGRGPWGSPRPLWPLLPSATRLCPGLSVPRFLPCLGACRLPRHPTPPSPSPGPTPQARMAFLPAGECGALAPRQHVGPHQRKRLTQGPGAQCLP